MARDPWKVTSIVWPAIVSALMPLSLAELVPKLLDITRRLGGYDSQVAIRAPRQLELFRRVYVVRRESGDG